MNVFRDPKIDFTQKRYEFEADNGKQASTFLLCFHRMRLISRRDCIDHQGTVSLSSLVDAGKLIVRMKLYPLPEKPRMPHTQAMVRKKT
jgi:hypothetical protein